MHEGKVSKTEELQLDKLHDGVSHGPQEGLRARATHLVPDPSGAVCPISKTSSRGHPLLAGRKVEELRREAAQGAAVHSVASPEQHLGEEAAAQATARPGPLSQRAGQWNCLRGSHQARVCHPEPRVPAAKEAVCDKGASQGFGLFSPAWSEGVELKFSEVFPGGEFVLTGIGLLSVEEEARESAALLGQNYAE